MHGTCLIEVSPKPGRVDPSARALQEDIRHLGLLKVQCVATAQLYRLVGELTAGERLRIAQDLLCDPVLQEFHDGGRDTGGHSLVIDVWFKSGVTDVVGESVLKGLHDLGVDGLTEVRTGTRYRFSGRLDAKGGQKLALGLLANPLIHDRFIHVS